MQAIHIYNAVSCNPHWKLSLWSLKHTVDYKHMAALLNNFRTVTSTKLQTLKPNMYVYSRYEIKKTKLQGFDTTKTALQPGTSMGSSPYIVLNRCIVSLSISAGLKAP